MANIRGLGDLNQGNNPNNNANNDQNNPNPAEPSSVESLFQNQSGENANVWATCEKLRVPFYSGASKIKHPNDENYCDFFLYNICPVIRPLSFTVIICVIDLAIFVATLAVGINLAGNLLAVKAQTLYDFKAVYAISIYKGEVYRLLTAVALHANFMHIFGNLLTTVVILSRVEYTYGVWWSMLIYFVSGIGGNIFSVVVNGAPYNIVSVGASTSLFGIIGLLLGYIIINYPALSFMGFKMRCNLIVTVIVMVMFSLLVSAGISYVDNWGHLGGFLTGLWCSSFPTPLQSNRRQNIVRGVFIGLFVSQMVICFMVFYLGKPDLKMAAANSPY